MKILSYLLFVILLSTPLEKTTAIQQQEVLQTVLNIVEFQEYLSYVPRYIGSNTKQEVLMLKFEELESPDIQLNIREKTIRIITDEEANQLEHKIFIKVNQFDMQGSTAKVNMSYQSARMYFETNQEILLNVQLKRTETEDWIVENYELNQTNISTSD